MLISEGTDCQYNWGKPVAITGTSCYNRKVNRGKGKPKSPDCIYRLILFVMNYEKKLLKEKEVCNLMGFSKSTLWRLVGKNDFPKPIKFGQRMTRWNSYEVHLWMDEICSLAK